jgi:hypothetical protein
MKPIFMIGTQRSGSNLLRLMLNQLAEVAAPHPPHILQRLMPLTPGYGDLRLDDNFHQLVDDACRLVELNPVPWEGMTLDRRKIAAQCRTRSLVAVHGAIYDAYAKTRGAATWCCKSLANILYVPQLEDYFDRPRYIYLYRDGRDVALSFRKAVVGEKHFYHIAKEWAATQELALKWQQRIDAGRFLSVSYEELVGSPRTTAHMLCDFLGAAFRAEMLDYHRSDEAHKTASSSDLWSNVSRPVMQSNTKKFLREVKEDDVRVFESMAGYVLDALGYERVFVKKGEERVFSPEEVASFDAENARCKAELRKLVDPADLMRRDLQAGLLKEVKDRQTSLRATTLEPAVCGQASAGKAVPAG